jgi:hypothetical protein
LGQIAGVRRAARTNVSRDGPDAFCVSVLWHPRHGRLSFKALRARPPGGFSRMLSAARYRDPDAPVIGWHPDQGDGAAKTFNGQRTRVQQAIEFLQDREGQTGVVPWSSLREHIGNPSKAYLPGPRRRSIRSLRPTSMDGGRSSSRTGGVVLEVLKAVFAGSADLVNDT